MSDVNLAAAAQIILAAQAARPHRPVIRTFFDEPTNTATHVIHDPATMRGAVIDSVLDFDAAAGRTTTKAADALLAYVTAKNITLDWLLETHAHADHLSAAPYLQKQAGGKLAIGQDIIAVQNTFGKIFNAGTEFARDGSEFDQLFADGDRFTLGNIPCMALHVPGHTPADMAYVISDAVFTGDTLFMPDYGTARADFPGGDAAHLYRSIRRLLSLPDTTRLYLCHDYKTATRAEYAWETTVAEERQRNIHAHEGITEENFVAMRTARDATLAVPKLLLPAVQVNMRAGHLPPAEANGTTYLKVPINIL